MISQKNGRMDQRPNYSESISEIFQKCNKLINREAAKYTPLPCSDSLSFYHASTATVANAIFVA